MSELIKLQSSRRLFKGRPKTRKTSNIAAFPGKHYFFLFDPDGANPIIKFFPDRVKSGEIKWNYYNRANIEDADTKMRELLANNPFDNVSIDSLTLGGQWSMDYGVEKAGNLDKVGFVRMPGFKEYGVEHNIMMALIGAGFVLSQMKPCNFFLTAHVMERQIFAPDGKLLRTKQRLISGGQALAEKVLATFKEVFHFEDVSDSLVVGAQKSYKVYTSTRGENIASTDLPIPGEFDVTNSWLYDSMKKELEKKGFAL